MIHVDQLTKFYGRNCAVDGISFEVGKGEIVGFLGPNGAGKSTTIKMLTSFLSPSSGIAEIGGHNVVTDSMRSRSKIGYMPENVPLYEDMRVKEYLAFRARLKGLRGSDARKSIGESMDKTATRDVRGKIIRTLSKGYRQRVGLADALLGSPDLLILDEPTNGLDPNQIRQIRTLIRELSADHTVLLSTHILSEVEMICGHVIIIDGGTIKANDTPEKLVDNMRVAGRVSAEIKGDKDQISEALAELPHIKKVLLDESDDEGWQHFSIRVDSHTDARERIASLARENHWPIRQLYRHQPTLEEVFVELTRKD